ncbi:MAG: MAPEG family protein [Arenimonas sp.]|nr:MAPEG family protein [Arenimonas sp.]
MHLHAALITALNSILVFIAMAVVGRARGRHQIKAPAVTGNPDFERAFRAHQNTLEQTVMFLPVLWLASIYANEQYAAWLGYAWLLGRLWYIYGYVKAADSRGGGFTLAIAAWAGLLLLSLKGLVSLMLA